MKLGTKVEVVAVSAIASKIKQPEYEKRHIGARGVVNFPAGFFGPDWFFVDYDDPNVQRFMPHHVSDLKPIAKNKFGARIEYSPIFDRKFRSGVERDRAEWLHFLQTQGQISNLEIEPQLHLTAANVSYRPDSKYFDRKLGETVYEDVKGIHRNQQRFAIICDLWSVYGPGILRVVRRNTSSKAPFEISETIIPEKPITDDSQL